jgi:hypothetical protein
MSGRHTKASDRPKAWPKGYLGDGVYAAFDGFGVWITAEDGIVATDAIYVEPAVLNSLIEFYKANGGKGLG